MDADTWWLMVGSEYTPSGYAWIFPVSPDTVRIGVGVGKPDWSENPTVLLDKIIKEKTGPIASLGKISPFEFHSGIIPNDGTVRRTSLDARTDENPLASIAILHECDECPSMLQV